MQATGVSMGRSSFSSVRFRLLTLVLLIFLPLVALTVYAGLEERRTAAALAEEEALRLVRLASQNQLQQLEGARGLLVAVSRLPEVRGDAPGCGGLLADLQKQYPRFVNIGVAAPNGDVYCSARPPGRAVNIADRPYFRRAIGTRAFAVGDYQIGRITGVASLTAGHPVLDRSGSLRAVVFVAIDLAWLSDLLRDAQLPEGGALTVVDSKGTILARYPDAARWVGKALPETPLVRAILETQGAGTIEAAGIDGVRRLYAFTPLGSAGQAGRAFITVGIPTVVAFAEANRTLARNLTTLGVVAVLALAAAWVFADRTLLRNVGALVRATQRLSAGDLSARTGLADTSGDLGQLARAFDGMAVTLQARQAEAEMAEEALRRYSQRLEVLHKIDQAILTAQSPEAIAAAALPQIARLIPCRSLSLVTLDRAGKEARALAAYGHSTLQAGARFSLEGLGDLGALFSDLQNGRSHVLDVHTLPGSSPIIRAARAEGTRYVCVVPLLAQGWLLGAFSIGLDTPAPHSPNDLAIAREIADQVAVALQHTGLRQTLQRNAEELEARVSERTGELREAMAFLEHLISSGPVVIFRGDLKELKMSYVSSNVERLLGYAPDEILGVADFWLQHMHPDDRERFQVQVQRVLEDKAGQLETEYRFLHKQGHYRWLYSVGRLAHDEASGSVSTLGYALDVTERKQAEEALKQSENRFRLVVESAGDGIILADDEGTIISWNAAAQRLFGYTAEEVLGQPLTVLMPERYREAHRMGLRRYRSTGVARVIGKTVELSGLRKDGPEFPLELSLNAWQTGGRSYFCGIVRDTTSRKVAEEALHAAKEEAERANQAKSEFLSRMSHELRTPLNAILGFAQLLEMDSLTPAQREGVEQILRGGEHLLKLINEILDIARIESGRLRLSLEPVPVEDVLRQVLDLVRPLAVQRHVYVDGGVVDGERRYVLADYQRLTQVILNLLSNAIKFNREGGTVRVACDDAPENRLSIHVHDTGPGIPRERMDQLFVPFARLGVEQSGVEGTGIGLALSKGLVELMGGTIGVRSTLGQGSTFWVELPLVDSPVEQFERLAAEAAGSLQGAVAARSLTVLYIENNLANLGLIQRIFAGRPEVKLLTAIQGRMGLELARQHDPDVILLDLNLPDLPGEEVLRRLQSDLQARRVPVVVISAEATPGEAERMIALGAHAYLTKPLDVRKFVGLLNEMVRAAVPHA